MIKHIVMWKLKDENKIKNAALLKKKLLALKDQIKEIKEIEVGINSQEASSENYDVVLVSEFLSMEELNKYTVHPTHQDLVKYVKTIRDIRTAVDYEI